MQARKEGTLVFAKEKKSTRTHARMLSTPASPPPPRAVVSNYGTPTNRNRPTEAVIHVCACRSAPCLNTSNPRQDGEEEEEEASLYTLLAERRLQQLQRQRRVQRHLAPDAQARLPPRPREGHLRKRLHLNDLK